MILEKRNRRKRFKRVPRNSKRNPVLQFQREHNAIVKFNTSCINQNGNRVVKCEVETQYGLATHAYGRTIIDAFRNMKAMYNLKYLV